MQRVAQGDDLNARIHIGDPASDEGRELNYVDMKIQATDSDGAVPGKALITFANATGVTLASSGAGAATVITVSLV